MKVLVADDDPVSREAICACLSNAGFDVSVAADGAAALEMISRPDSPRLLVLDRTMPHVDGMDVCRTIRKKALEPDVYIILLTGRGEREDMVEGFEAGADDYMTKPFGMRELNARLQVALRHRAPADEQVTELDVGPLHLDLVHYEAIMNGRSLDLTAKEFEFLAYLARNAGKVCTRQMILESVWGPAYARETHYLKVYAYRIRRKLHDEGGEFLQSDPSVGYRLVPPAMR